MITLIWRQLKKAALIQVSLAVLFASAVTVFLIYSAYIAQENRLASSRIAERIPAGHYLVETQQPVLSTSVSTSLILVGAWQQLSLESSIGRLPSVMVGNHGTLSTLAPPGTALVHHTVAQRFNLSVGSSIVISYGGQVNHIKVHGIYSEPSSTQGYDFGDRTIIFAGQPVSTTYFLYTTPTRDVQWAQTNLLRAHPGSKVIAAGMDPNLSALIEQSNAIIVQRSKASLVFFVAVAFLTARVLGFMDNRRILAILKAIGLKNIEVSHFMLLDSVIAPLAGAVGGGALGFMMLNWFEQRGAGLSFTSAILFQALLSLVPAVAIGVYIPARLAKMASVNELAHERSIPLMHETVTCLAKRTPGLDRYVAQGVQFVKLDVVDGVFDGYVFRRLGDTVRQGEVLAVATRWWGLKTKEFLAPISGTVVIYEPTTGVMGVGPD